MTEGQEKSTPHQICTLTMEIRNLAHRGWLDRPNAEFLFREIGKKAFQISQLADQALRSVAGGEPQEGKHSYDALWDRAFAECVLTKYGGPECPQEPDSVKSGLKYIADSPSKEHGGFHPQTVEIAKQALARIEQLEAGGEPEQPAPIHPFEVRITICGETWEYVLRQLRDLLDDARRREPKDLQGFGGGGGGSYSITTATRDISPEDFRAELTAWHESLPAPPQGKEQK